VPCVKHSNHSVSTRETMSLMKLFQVGKRLVCSHPLFLFAWCVLTWFEMKHLWVCAVHSIFKKNAAFCTMRACKKNHKAASLQIPSQDCQSVKKQQSRFFTFLCSCPFTLCALRQERFNKLRSFRENETVSHPRTVL